MLDVDIPYEWVPLEASHLENNEQLRKRPNAVVGVAYTTYMLENIAYQKDKMALNNITLHYLAFHWQPPEH